MPNLFNMNKKAKESGTDKNIKIACSRIINYCKESNIFESIAEITIVGTYLSRWVDISSLESVVREVGLQWEKAKIAYQEAPAKVECNECGQHFNSKDDWWPCPNCGHPGGSAISPTPLHIRLKEIRLEMGKVIKAKRNTIIL